MKKDTAIIRKLVIAAIIVAVVTISLIAFVGVFERNQNKMTDAIPGYILGTEFEGNREYKFSIDSSSEEKEVYVDSEGKVCGEVISDNTSDTGVEVNVEGDAESIVNGKKEIDGYTIETKTIKANEDDVLTPDSYKKSKKIIENRLEEAGVAEYNVRLDEESGKLVVEIPDDENSNFVYQIISSQGIFDIIDSQTGLKLMDNSYIKKATVNYANNNGTYQVYLQLNFNKEGKEILKNISNEYVEKEVPAEETTTEETAETTETAETPKTEISYIQLRLDNTDLLKTYFSEELDQGMVQIPLNTSIQDTEELKNAVKSASAIASIINNGKLPNKFVLENDNFLKSTIKQDDIKIVKIAFAIVVLVISVLLVIKYGLNGILGAILNVGLIGAVSIIVRYTNVTVTISSIAAALLVVLLNAFYMVKLLSKLKLDKPANEKFADATINYYLSIVPVIIVSVAFSLMTNAAITGIGMILFWGLLIQVIYNLIFTRTVYVLKDK